MKAIRSLGGIQPLLLRGLGWLYCALLYALYYGAALRLWQGEAVLPLAFFRGLLAAVPLAAADLGAFFCGGLGRYALASGGVFLGGWLLLGHVWAALPLLLVCAFRAKIRLSEEPVDSVLDAPHLPGILAVLPPFFLGVVLKDPVLQKICWGCAGMYGLLWAAYWGIRRIQRYLQLNQGMAELPVKRMVRTSGLALAGILLVAGALLFPALLSLEPLEVQPQKRIQGEVRLPEPADSPEMTSPVLPTEVVEAAERGFRLPEEILWVAGVLVGLAAAAAVLWGVYQFVRNFRGTFVDHRDVVQYLDVSDETAEQSSNGAARRRPRFWDRSPSAQVRRKYRRAVLRGSRETPPVWASPTELEARAGLQDPQLHWLYEKARYSREGCTPEESRSLTR